MSNFFYKGTNLDEIFEGNAVSLKNPSTEGYNTPEYVKSGNNWERYKSNEMIIPYLING